MPSIRHEAVLLLLRARPALLGELLRAAAGLDLPALERIAFTSETVRELAPIELRADAVLSFGDDDCAPIAILEVQLAIDDAKRAVWPVYLAVIHRETRRPVLLIVATLDDDTARWAAEPIAIGPGSRLAPFVLGPREIPRIVDADVARQNVELSVLSTLAHGRDEREPELAARIAGAAIEAIATGPALDDDHREIYADLVLAALGPAARQLLETLMQKGTYEFQSDFAQHYIALGREEGREEGRQAGAVHALLALLRARGIELSAAREAAVRTCTDLATLDGWLLRAAVATAEREVFGDG